MKALSLQISENWRVELDREVIIRKVDIETTHIGKINILNIRKITYDTITYDYKF